jgi:predicted alpha/beta-fold hydrolase
MTVVAWAKTRQFPGLPVPQARLFQVTADTQVLARCYWQPDRASRPTLLALHGLEGSSEVHYMRGLAHQAWRRGWNAVLLNQRNCGGTEHLTPGLYHSGLTEDPIAVITELREVDRLPVFGVVGYSLGGNLTVKLASEASSSSSGRDLGVRAAVAVCPTIDLDVCVHAIERRANYAYHWNFVRNLKARMRRKAHTWPGAFDLSPLDGIRSIRRFDDVYTAPFHGFGDALNYYHRASAMRGVERIAIPTLILAAEDDPFVPPSQFRCAPLTGHRWVTVRVEPHGGHCGFIGEPAPDGDDYWAEATAVRFLAEQFAR